jgi:hypothetical protein
MSGPGHPRSQAGGGWNLVRTKPCGGEEAGVMSDYDMTTMRIESASIFFRRLTYALFIGWVVYGVYLFFMGDWWSVNLLMIFIAFAVSFIVYRTLEIIIDKR